MHLESKIPDLILHFPSLIFIQMSTVLLVANTLSTWQHACAKSPRYSTSEIPSASVTPKVTATDRYQWNVKGGMTMSRFKETFRDYTANRTPKNFKYSWGKEGLWQKKRKEKDKSNNRVHFLLNPLSLLHVNIAYQNHHDTEITNINNWVIQPQ